MPQVCVQIICSFPSAGRFVDLFSGLVSGPLAYQHVDLIYVIIAPAVEFTRMLLRQNFLWLRFFLPIRTDGFISDDWSEEGSGLCFKRSLQNLQASGWKPKLYLGTHHIKYPILKFRLYSLRQAELSLYQESLMPLLLQNMQMVHSAYLIQPRKKDTLKVLLKLLAQSKYSSSSLKVSQSRHWWLVGAASLCLNCKTSSPLLLQKVFLKDVPELSNHIDRSQLTAALGGYLVYCHQSWVSFIKVTGLVHGAHRAVDFYLEVLPYCHKTL